MCLQPGRELNDITIEDYGIILEHRGGQQGKAKVLYGRYQEEVRGAKKGMSSVTKICFQHRVWPFFLLKKKALIFLFLFHNRGRMNLYLICNCS